MEYKENMTDAEKVAEAKKIIGSSLYYKSIRTTIFSEAPAQFKHVNKMSSNVTVYTQLYNKARACRRLIKIEGLGIFNLGELDLT